MSINDVIELNVGGKRFITSRQTLLKESQSVLAKMFEIDSPIQPAAILKDGSYFIDRDSKRFEVILNFLRDNVLLDDLSKTELKSLKIEASYFMLEDLLSIINERLDNMEVYRFRYYSRDTLEFCYYVRKSYFEGVPLHVIVNFFSHRWTGAFRSSPSKDPFLGTYSVTPDGTINIKPIYSRNDRFEPSGTHFVTPHDDIININPIYNRNGPTEHKQYIEEGRMYLVEEFKRRNQQE